ncbi:MAG: hypothetical protein QOK10_3813 [Pseudonocardiales bacterium]|jgi:uncharacterized protein (DUF427 family)|nr:hypothetical protein [Pseudonocardiales bacterium]
MNSTQRGRITTEPGRKRIRALLNGQYILDTTRPLLVWEVPYYPAYYIPREDVAVELIPNGETTHSPSRGDATVFDVKVGEELVSAGAYGYLDSPLAELNGLVRFDWNAVDQWFEEDEPVYFHPRNPYTRIDILSSSRHIQVEIDGVLLADSHQPRILYETGLPPRYYLPQTDVRMDLLAPSATHTDCPYKGTASYFDVEVGGKLYADHVWWYPTPLPESQKIIGLLSFYDEKVDVIIDGVRQERPKSIFS